MPSRIEWTQSTWNPVTGCTKVSPGCDHCYADRMAQRLQAMGVHKYRNGFNVTLHPSELEAPLRWRKPQIIFVNSMSDLFHPSVPFSYVEQIFDVMRRADHHIFQILTKRSKQLVRAADKIDWPPNVWMGVTVESQTYTFRISDLRKTKAAVKFLSLEPLLGPLVDLDLHNIDWAIVGGESGPGARPVKREWVESIRKQCKAADVHFFFKQWGGVNKKAAGRILNRTTYDAMPPLPDPIVALGQESLVL